VLLLSPDRSDGTTPNPSASPAPSEPVELAAGGTEPTSQPTTQAGLPAPPAPWDTEPVRPTGYLADVAREWAAKSRTCDLYAPIAVESQAQLRNGKPIEQVQEGWFWFGWTGADSESESSDAAFANVGIWPVDDPPGVLDLYLDSGEEPRAYRDGSKMYFSEPVGGEDGRLIAIAGQDCYYEVRASDDVTMSWMLGSLRPIDVEK
jgi:hypothetical protein